MASGNSSQAASVPAADAEAFEMTGKKKTPEWATGLKQFYDSVVDEPLPDTFQDLLSQLDDEDARS